MANSRYIGTSNPFAEGSGPNRKSELNTDDINTLKSYADAFDKIVNSNNPSVKRAWKDLTLLLTLTQEANGKTDLDVEKDYIDPLPGGPFRRLANQVDKSLSYHRELEDHVSGLQYQIDDLKKRLSKLIEEGRESDPSLVPLRGSLGGDEVESSAKPAAPGRSFISR